jgi:hypothetical protein
LLADVRTSSSNALLALLVRLILATAGFLARAVTRSMPLMTPLLPRCRVTLCHALGLGNETEREAREKARA